MEFSETQKAQINEIIDKAQDYEFKISNKIVAIAVKEWQDNIKTDKEAYDKIYKKVVKNEYHLSHRYSKMNDARRITLLAELYVENILDDDLFDELDEDIRNKVFNITKIKK